MSTKIPFRRRRLTARLGDPNKNFALVDLPVELRRCPLLQRATRITVKRIKGAHLREDEWPDLDAPLRESEADCPFCPAAVEQTASALDETRFGARRLTRGQSLLFPNLAPYGLYSAVTIVSHEHYTEVGAFQPADYTNAFLLTRDYLRQVLSIDKTIRYAAITQNHLPASGGTIIHPHLQAQADAQAPAFIDNLWCSQRSAYRRYRRPFWPLLAESERECGERYIAEHRGWHWLTMWAPQGYREVYGIHPGPAVLDTFTDETAAGMVDGLLRVQRWYRRRNRNSFNLAVYFARDASPADTLVCRILARANWAPFGRSDRSFFELMLGEQVLDEFPEDWARELRDFF